MHHDFFFFSPQLYERAGVFYNVNSVQRLLVCIWSSLMGYALSDATSPPHYYIFPRVSFDIHLHYLFGNVSYIL